VRGLLLSALLFVDVSSPFIAAPSKQKGRLTFGDSGRLAYATVSPGSPQVHGQGVPAGFRNIQLDNFLPPVFEFATPVGGAYPPGYDPSYWNEGMRASFRVRSQIRVLLQSARNYAIMLPGQVGLDCRLVCFYFLG
jgi:hypothetical protein